MSVTSRRPALLLLAGCLTAIVTPQLAARHAQPAPSAAAAATAVDVRVDRFVDRVWIVASDGGPAEGTRYVFLSDNTLLVVGRDGALTSGTWAEDVGGFVFTERGSTSTRGTSAGVRVSKVEVLALTADAFRLRIAGPKGTTDLTLTPAIAPPVPVTTTAVDPTAAGAATAPPRATAPPVAPLGSPFRCGADTFRVAFENNKAYVTWPDGSVLVLDETKVPDAPLSRRTYTDGEHRVVEDTSEAYTRVLFARPGFRPRPCTPAR